MDIDPDDGQSPIGTGWQSATISTRFSISRARAPPPPPGGGGRGEWNINSFRRATSQSRMSGTRVRFSHLVVVHRLNDADEDRRASWMSLARDRHRFKRRIDRLSIVLDRILTTEHRLKVAARNTKI